MTAADIDWAAIEIRELIDPQDTALPGLLDIYQKSFPLEEQMLVSFFLHLLAGKGRGEAEEYHLEVLAADAVVGGFALYEIGDEVPGVGRPAYLWYVAAHGDVRGQSIGKRLYRHVLDKVLTHYGCAGLFFEIEQAGDVLVRHGKEAADFAAWRREWYRRQGARQLRGVSYLCSVEWQPAVPMDVMVHPAGIMTAEAALTLARSVQSESIEVTGELELV